MDKNVFSLLNFAFRPMYVLDRSKKFEHLQNRLGPLEGQGIISQKISVGPKAEVLRP